LSLAAGLIIGLGVGACISIGIMGASTESPSSARADERAANQDVPARRPDRRAFLIGCIAMCSQRADPFVLK
jgi:hypothetical protein